MAAPGTPEWHDQVARERQLRDAQFRAQQDAFNRAQRERNEAARVKREASAENSRQMMYGMMGMHGSGSSYRMGQALAGRDYNGKLISEKYQQVQTPNTYKSRPLTESEIKEYLVSHAYKELRNIFLDNEFRKSDERIRDGAVSKLSEFAIKTHQLGLYRKDYGVGDIFDRLQKLSLDPSCKERLARLSSAELREMLTALAPFKATNAEIFGAYSKRIIQNCLRFAKRASLAFFNCLTLWFVLSILVAPLSLAIIATAIESISYHNEFIELAITHGDSARSMEYNLERLRDAYLGIGIAVLITVFCIGNVVRIVKIVGKPLSSILEHRP